MFIARYVNSDGEIFECSIVCTLRSTAAIQAAQNLEEGDRLISIRRAKPTDQDPGTDIFDGTATGFGHTKKEE